MFVFSLGSSDNDSYFIRYIEMAELWRRPVTRAMVLKREVRRKCRPSLLCHSLCIIAEKAEYEVGRKWLIREGCP